MFNSMETAPKDRLVTLVARQMLVGVGPMGNSFYVTGWFDSELNMWVAEDNPRGLPSLGLIPLSPIGWIC